MTAVDWRSGDWLNPPPRLSLEDGSLIVTTAPESDFWRTTSYGFVRDSGHALLIEFPPDTSVEVAFAASFANQFDQAGIMVRASEAHWIKAGVEFADGLPQVGAVVTRDVSDWSVSPVPDWAGAEVTVRVSRSGDALTVRAGINGDLRLVRLAPLDPGLEWRVGPFCCSPGGSALDVRFTSFTVGAADTALHVDDL